MTIFVGNLPYDANECDVEALFKHKASARVIIDRETNRSKGFAFVDLDTPELARQELERLNEKPVTLKGRQIRFGEADRKPEKGNRQGGNSHSSGGGNFKPRNEGRKPRSNFDRQARNRGYATSEY